MRLVGLVLLGVCLGTVNAGAESAASQSDQHPVRLTQGPSEPARDGAAALKDRDPRDEAIFHDAVQRAFEEYDEGRWLGVCPLS